MHENSRHPFFGRVYGGVGGEHDNSKNIVQKQKKKRKKKGKKKNPTLKKIIIK